MLIATSVMPLVAQARGDGSGAHAHAVHGIDHDDADDGHGSDPGDLAHHAQSHAQTLGTRCVVQRADERERPRRSLPDHARPRIG